MGCASSKKQKQIEFDGELYNKDSDDRRKLVTGFQMSKDADGTEANFQIAFWKKKRKKYEKVMQPLIEDEERVKKKIFFERCLCLLKKINQYIP